MKKVAPENVIDVLPCPDGFVYITQNRNDNNTVMASFFLYNQLSGNTSSISKAEYQKIKFGFAFEPIVDTIVDYIFCDAGKFSDNTVLVNTHVGDMYVFDSVGDLSFDGKILYKDCTLHGSCVDDNNLWCAVRDKNCIINYSPVKRKILYRIGGGVNTSFDKPVSVFKSDNEIYVCNSGNNVIRVFNTSTLTASNYLKFTEPLHKYFKVGACEYIFLKSGVYSLSFDDKANNYV